jgi:hypothetical protein
LTSEEESLRVFSTLLLSHFSLLLPNDIICLTEATGTSGSHSSCDPPAKRKIYHYPVEMPRKSQSPSLGQPTERLKWRGPPRADDLTSVHPGQVNWSIDNLPDILYVLRPTREHRLPRKSKSRTKIQIFGQYVNELPILPRRISSKVEGWRLEAWMRMDSRIAAQDIIDRVNPIFKLTPGDIQMRRFRFRQAFNLASWATSASISAVEALLREASIDPAHNTTRGLTPGLVSPAEGEAGGRIPNPPNYRSHESVRQPSTQRAPSDSSSSFCMSPEAQDLSSSQPPGGTIISSPPWRRLESHWYPRLGLPSLSEPERCQIQQVPTNASSTPRRQIPSIQITQRGPRPTAYHPILTAGNTRTSVNRVL